MDKNGKRGFGATVIPNRGAWLEYETDARDVVHVRIDRTRKLPITVLLRALGFSTDEEIIDLIGDNEYLRNTLEKDNTETLKKHCLKYMNVFAQVNHQHLIVRRISCSHVFSMQKDMT